MHRQRASPPTLVDQVSDADHCGVQECNIILGAAFEYREPSRKAIEAAAAEADAEASAASKLRVNMTSRFLGLIVVPGQHITMIKLEDA